MRDFLNRFMQFVVAGNAKRLSDAKEGSKIISDQARNVASRFLQKTDGAISVEVVLWLPIYLTFITLIVDVSSMMHSRTVALRILEDANRHAVTGYLVDEAEVTTQISTQMQQLSGGSQIDVEWAADDIRSSVSYPASDTQIIGLLSVFTDLQLTVTTYNRFEI